MGSHRQRRNAKQQRQSRKAEAAARARGLTLANRVERLVYTREQAAEALGVSLATLDRRVIPVIATVETEWGRRLIPVSELERYVVERTRPPQVAYRPPRRAGRKTGVAAAIVERIDAEHAAGRTFGEIARALNADGVRTAQGGKQWWPSTVRSVLVRSHRRTSAQGRRGSKSEP